MSFENFQQNFANATGLIVDRTVEPPLVLGQAFVVSKSRAVTCASCVFNYAEAPWALAVNFPHPDIILGLKSIALHPDFDKKEARGRYLSQTGLGSDEGSNAQLNDLATLVLDPTLQALQQEKVSELRRALTLPFSNVGVEASGAITDGDFLSIVNTVLESGREGLLTLFDVSNIPVARIKIDAGKITKVYYKTLVNEMAFSELVFRKPAKGFAFQPQGSVKWEDIRDISVPTVNLVGESNRRASEIPNLLSRLGGGGARYQKAVQQFDSAGSNENIRWLVERLWLALDGYITVDKLPERIGADTYSVAQGLKELANRGVVSLLNRATPFACSGQLGTPLVSHTDFDINPGDPLTAFYLDPLSGAPNWRQGNFSGVSSVLQPKNLLHTIQIPGGTPGALILKNYKLVGVHNGAMQPKPGQSAPDGKLYQMMWIGALLDMSTKRLREGEGRQGEPAMAGLRSRLEETEQPQEAAAAAKLEKFICPNCYSTNTKVGPCFNCGTVIEPPPPEPEVTGLMAKPPFKQLNALKKQYNVTNLQLGIALGIVIGFPLFGMMFCSGPAPVTQTPVEKPTVGHNSSEAAVRTAVQYAGFKGIAPPGYWYEDTSEITKPNKSFGLYSEPSNQKVMFVVFDDMAPVRNLDNFTKRPLFTDAKNLIGTQELDKNPNVSTGKQILGTGDLNYFVGHYETGGNPDVPILIGSFPSKVPGKSILVIGQALSNDTPYDSKSTLFLADQMAEEFTKDGNRQRLGVAATPPPKPQVTGENGSEKAEVTYATDEQIEEFLGNLRKQLQEKLSLPKEAADELKKKKSKKLKTAVSVGIDNDGNVKKLEITEPSEWDKINNAVVKDINSHAPFKDAPKTKEGMLTFVVYLKRDQLSVELP